MPRSHGLILCCAMICMAGGLLSAEETPRAASEVRRLVDEAKFSEAETHLTTLAQSHRSEDVRIATVLYAVQQAYATGRRDVAEKWLRTIEADAPAKLKPAVTDALLWVRCDALDSKLPTPLLLEQATKHGRSSLGAVALMQRADQLAEQDRNDEALWIYHELARLYATTRYAPQAMLKAAKLHHQLGQQKETVEWTERLIKEQSTSPEAPAALYLLASAAMKLGDETKSNAALEQLVAHHATSIYWPDAAYRLAEHYFKTSQADQASELIKRALEHANMTSALRARSYFLQAQTALAQRDWSAAEAALTRVIAEKPESALLQLASYWQAETAFQRGDFKLATERFNAIASKTNANEDWAGMIPLRQAQLAVRRQDWIVALERLNHLTQTHPKFNRQQEADYIRARAYLGQAKFREARTVLEKIVATKTISETTAMAQWMIGESYFLQRQYENALPAYDATLAYEKFPNWQAAALLQSAKCCEQLTRKAEAVSRYERIVREFSATPHATEAKRRLTGERARASLAEQPPVNELNRK